MNAIVRRLVPFPILTASILLTSCATSPSTAPGPTEVQPGTQSATAAPPSSSADAAAIAAKAAYLGMWSDFVTAGHTSDWQSPQLAAHATGDALSLMSRGLYADHYNGLVTKGEPKNDPHVTSLEPADAPAEVTIADCGDSTGWLRYSATTGDFADTDHGGRQAIAAEVAKQPDGTWKVTSFTVNGIGTC